MKKLLFLPIFAVALAPPAATAQTPPSSATARAVHVQPVQEYFIPFADAPASLDFYNTPIGYTHLGTDYGRMGPSADRIHWQPADLARGRPSAARADLRGGAWAGMWHSLAGLARERDQVLDFTRCYPAFIRDACQPRCVGISVRVQGTGTLKLEVKSPGEEVLWHQTLVLNTGDHPEERRFECSPEALRSAKLLNWVAEPGANLGVGHVGLVIEYPVVPFEQWTFLVSYAKFARCALPEAGLVKDRAQLPAGSFEAVPASGLFALATAAAVERGVVEPKFALKVLHQTHKAVAALPRADGLLPHFVSRAGNGYRIHPGTEYSTVDTSLYYHGMLLAAAMLNDTATEAELQAAVRTIDFAKLRDANGRIVHGLREDGRTPLTSAWNDWGGETALVLMLEKMAMGAQAKPQMNKSGEVDGGVGFIAELQSLFYPQFGSDKPDALTGVNWLKARKALLKAQRAYFPKNKPGCKAAELGLYGLSAGEGYRGQSYEADGSARPNAELIRPHYLLMAGLLCDKPDETYVLLRAMEDRGLMPPWGLVENFKADLSEYLPMLGSLNAAFECLAAYHLQAWATGRPDQVYEAARKCTTLAAAAEVFFPQDRADAAGR